jgi:hypothetical protein
MPFPLLRFLKKISCSYVLDSVSLRIPTRSIRDYSVFTVHRKLKLSPAARCVSVANALTSLIKIVFCVLILVSFFN